MVSRWRAFQYPPPASLAALSVRFEADGTLGQSLELVKLVRKAEAYEVQAVRQLLPPFQKSLADNLSSDTYLAVNILDTPGLIAGYFDAAQQKETSPLEFVLPGAIEQEFAIEVMQAKDQVLVAAIRHKVLTERVDQLALICGTSIDAVSFGYVRTVNLSNSLPDGQYAAGELCFSVFQNETSVSNMQDGGDPVVDVALDGFQVPVSTLSAIALALANEQADFGAAPQVVEKVSQRRDFIAVRRTLLVGLGSAVILFLFSYFVQSFVGKRTGKLEQLAFRQNQRLNELQESSKEREQRNTALLRLGAKAESYAPHYLSQFLSLAPEGVLLTEATGQPPEDGKRPDPDQLTFVKGVYLLKGETKDVAKYLSYRKALEGNAQVDHLKDLTYTQTADGGVTFAFEVYVK